MSVSLKACYVAGFVFAGLCWFRVFGSETSNSGILSQDKSAQVFVLKQLQTELEHARIASERRYIERLIERQRAIISEISRQSDNN